jgi:hypothetical protein
MTLSLDLRKVAGIVGVGIVLLLTSCQAPPTSTPRPSPTSVPSTPTAAPRISGTIPPELGGQDAQATMRFVLAVASAPRVDVFIDKKLAVSQLIPSELTPTIPLLAGKHLLEVVAANTALQSQNLLLEQSIELEVRETVIGVLMGAPTKFTFARISENIEPLEAGQGRVQVVSTLNNAVDIAIDNRQVGKITTAGQGTEPVVLNTGMHQFSVNSGDQTILARSIPLTERQVHTFILLGADSAGTLTFVIARSPTLREGRLRVLNLSLGLGPVDVYLGDRQLAAALDYRKASEWQHVRLYEKDLRLLKAGAAKDAAPVGKAQLALRADQTGDVVIYDLPSQLKVRFLPEELRPTISKFARLTVLNLAQGVPSVQTVSGQGPISGIGPVRYGEISPPASVPEGGLKLHFNTAGESVPRSVEEPASLPPFREGIAYLYVVTGEAGMEPLLLTTEVGVAASTVIPTVAPTALPANMMSIRVINATNDMNLLDVLQGDLTYLKAVRRGQVSLPVVLSPVAAPIRITDSEKGNTEFQISLESKPGQVVAWFVVGRAGRDVQLIAAPDDISNTASITTMSILQGIHASKVTPGIGIEAILLPEPLATQPATKAATASEPTAIGVELTAQGEISKAVTIQPGRYKFQARNLEQNLIILSSDEVTLEAGRRYEIVILEDSGNGQMFVIPLDRTIK